MNAATFVSQPYDAKEFSEFVYDFLPNFEEHKEVTNPQEKTVFTEINRLGKDETLDLAVYEFHHGRKDPRVTLTRDAFKVLKNYEPSCEGALAVFVNDKSKEYRFSLITSGLEKDPKTGNIKTTWSNPRRFSFILGGGITRNTPARRLEGEVQNIEELKKRFSVEALTKDFYEKIKTWFLRAKKEVKFPGADQFGTTDEEHQSMMTLRLITRLIFIWFLKEKGLVPEELFDENKIGKLVDLEKFSALSPYYRAILQNLFFATLNTPRNKRKWLKDSEFHGMNKNRGKQEYFRYRDFFKDEAKQKEFYAICDKIPFVNGGLFENLDGIKEDNDFQKDNDKRIDCFSEERSNLKPERLKVPDNLFFGEKGIITLLKQYNFTVEENTPNDEDIALDPELLGCVFEGLLSYVNSEDTEKQRGKETEKRKSGSYYTPRVIVDYMVSESLKAYLSTKVGDSECLESLFASDSDEEPKYKDNDEFKNAVAEALDKIKILDPACGSGAFPMGILSKMIQILERIGKIDIRKPHEIYKKKLDIIRDCIYGVDLQNIAVQISKLRFFISLLCEQEVDLNDENYGIEQLPNLETKIVCADSLIKISIVKIKDDPGYGEIIKPESDNLREQLKLVREKHFDARSPEDKAAYRNKDKDLRKRLKDALRYEKGVYISKGEAEKLAEWDPYDPNSVSSFFNPEWMFGISNFDIVIGNPPYIQLQRNNGELAQKYEDHGYETLAKKGDIYCLFYERGWQLLKDGGHLCFITSNKWMRAGYGEKTRELFTSKTNPKLLIDFAGAKVFENAAVDTNILLFSKSNNEHATKCAVVDRKSESRVDNLSVFVEKEHKICAFTGGDIWVIISPIEQSIKRKIEAVGTPLNKWKNIKINYGLKTGCNDAFIISTDKFEEILSECQTEEEEARTKKLIQRVLRGQDIKRPGYTWAGLWLIATLPCFNYDIDHYPAVKKYLISFGKERLEQTGKEHIIKGEKIKARAKTSYKWFELQCNISYWEDFSKPKVIYPETTQGAYFAYDEDSILIDKTCFMLISSDTTELKYLQATLRSRLFEYAYKRIFSSIELGENGYQYNKHALMKLPVAKTYEPQSTYSDSYFYKLYGLSQEEIDFIESCYRNESEQ